MNTTDIQETYTPALRSVRIDRDARVIQGTVLITENSVNGPNGKRRYSIKALAQIATMAEGLPAYANHVPREQAFRPRPVQGMIGRHRNVRYDASGRRVLSDLHVLEHQAPWVFSLAEELGDVVGNSLVARGVMKMDNGTEVVEEILAVRSADLVSDPASTKGLFEHRESFAQRSAAQEEEKTVEKTMKKMDVSQATLLASAMYQTGCRAHELGVALPQEVQEDRETESVIPEEIYGRLAEAIGAPIAEVEDSTYAKLSEAIRGGGAA